MEIKVRDLGQKEEKSKAEIEETLLQKHEDNFEDSDSQPETTDTVKVSNENDTEKETPSSETIDETPSSELNDENVLSYIKDRYNKDINSVDELFEEKKQTKNYLKMCLRI